MSSTSKDFTWFKDVLNRVGVDDDAVIRFHNKKLEILEKNAFWHIATDLNTTSFTVRASDLRAVGEALKYIDTTALYWSVGIKYLEFQTPKTTFKIPNVKSTVYEETAEIYLKPLLLNTFHVALRAELVKSAVLAVAPFGLVTTVGWTGTHLKLSAGSGSFSGEVNVPIVGPVEKMSFPSTWAGHYRTENLIKRVNLFEGYEKEMVLFKGAANKTNSPSPLVIEDKDSTISLVLSPLLDLPII